MRIPPSLEATPTRGEEWEAWLRTLPGRAEQVAAEWDLTPDGAPLRGGHSLVLPVRTAEGTPAPWAWTRTGPGTG